MASGGGGGRHGAMQRGRRASSAQEAEPLAAAPLHAAATHFLKTGCGMNKLGLVRDREFPDDDLVKLASRAPGEEIWSGATANRGKLFTSCTR
jgi:hypothetical protein